MIRRSAWIPLALVFMIGLAACGGSTDGTTGGAATSAPVANGGPTTIVLGAYSTPREAYGKLIPIFKDQWKKQTGQDITFQESYQGSGAQARAITQGFEADIAALSLEADINQITKAGLITHDWTTGTFKGMVSDSIVAFAVRKGNHKGIKDWADLAKPGIQILTPNPKTSGGAQWNILALYGAAKRGFVQGVPKDDAAATEFLKSILKNVTALDKDARTSITNFEQGIGDVAITYENEVLVGQQSGKDYELVIPSSTILIENPVALVDTSVDKHGNRKLAEAFVAFLFTPEAQQVFAETGGLRSVDPEVAKATAARFPAVTDLFKIDYLGGWKDATPKYFGDDGVFSKAISEVQQ